MIQRIITAVQTARTRPPGLLSLLVGAAGAGAGIALVQRYHQHQIFEVIAAAEELDRIEAACTAKRSELAQLGRQMAKPEPDPYPTRDDLDPLNRAEAAP